MITLGVLDTLPGIRHGFMTRAGGVSEGIYASLNCGPGSRDDAANVAENRARVAELVAERAGELERTGKVTHARDELYSFDCAGALELRDGVLIAIDGVDRAAQAEDVGEGAGEGAHAGAEVGPLALPPIDRLADQR